MSSKLAGCTTDLGAGVSYLSSIKVPMSCVSTLSNLCTSHLEHRLTEADLHLLPQFFSPR